MTCTRLLRGVMIETGSHQHPEDPSGAGSALLSSVHHTPFIGRQAELTLITRKIEGVQPGRGERLAVQSESGFGKSRLVLEALQLARKQGWQGVYAPCRGTELEPYSVLSGILMDALGIPQDAPLSVRHSRCETELTARSLPELVPMLTGLLDLPRGIQPPRESAVDGLHGGGTVGPPFTPILDGLAQVLGAGNGTPYLLVLDDCDEAASALQRNLLRLAERLEAVPVLFIASFGLDARSELLEAFEGDAITLGRLGARATALLCRSVLGVEKLEPALQTLIWGHTAGHPLFITMLLEQLRASGSILVDPESGGKAALAAQNPLPHLRDYVLERAQELPPGPRAALMAAAVAGDGFYLDLITAILRQLDGPAVLADLEALVSAGWLERDAVGPGARHRFASRLIRDLLHERMEPHQRSNLHQHAADYHATGAAGRTVLIRRAARHYLAAGAPTNALALVEEALAGAYHERNRTGAVELLKIGMEAAAGSQELFAQQMQLAEALGDIFAVEGDYRAAAQVYREMGPRLSGAIMLSKLGMAQLTFDTTAALRTLTTILPLIPPDHPQDLRWYVEASLAWAYLLDGQGYLGLRHIRDALAQIGPLAGYGSARALLRGMLGMILNAQGEQAEARPHLESARAGWGARHAEDGVVLMNRVLLGIPTDEITRGWVALALRPFLGEALVLTGPEIP